MEYLNNEWMNKERQIALCATLDDELKNRTERALLRAKVSYLMKCERNMEKEKKDKKVVFYIDKYQAAEALEAIQEIERDCREIEIFI